MIRSSPELFRSFGFVKHQPAFISFTLFNIILAPLDEVHHLAYLIGSSSCKITLAERLKLSAFRIAVLSLCLPRNFDMSQQIHLTVCARLLHIFAYPGNCHCDLSSKQSILGLLFGPALHLVSSYSM